LAAGVLAADDKEAVAKAEAWAAESAQLLDSSPERALARGREALALTHDFDPTVFVDVGRRGELVEDAFVKARAAYRRHRAKLYAAVGSALARLEDHVLAERYLRRAYDLDPKGPYRLALARSLVALGRGGEALATVLSRQLDSLSAEAIAVASAAADDADLASLQAEIDRFRLLRLETEPAPEHRAGPFELPRQARLSTGGPLVLDKRLTILYVAQPSCRSCSADLEELRNLALPEARIVMLPEDTDSAQALRQVMRLYRYDWPMLVKVDVARALGVRGPVLLVVGRGGWSNVVVRPPFARTLAPVLELLSRSDLSETLPRGSWNRRPPERADPLVRPALLEDGLAPGEDEPAPDEFEKAVAAYRAGRFSAALKLFDSLADRGDGWLLPPEARLNRALCLAGLGRREEARKLLLRIGDSRFQEDVDRTLERVGSQ
jgi:tetratricopeptide (TPR) repeat protein